MKIDKTVQKETVCVVIGELIMTALMVAVYLIIGKFELDVLISALIGASISILNFFMLGLTVQKAVTMEDENNRKNLMKISQSMRFLLIAVLIVVFCAVCKLPPIPMVIPLFFTRITFFVRQIIINKNDKKKISDKKSLDNKEG